MPQVWISMQYGCLDPLYRYNNRGGGFLMQKKGSPHSSISLFQLNICEPYTYLCASTDLEKVFDEADLCEHSKGKKVVLPFVSDIFANAGAKGDSSAVVHKLTSIEGGLVFSNLLTGSMHKPCQNPLCDQQVEESSYCSCHTPYTSTML